MMNVIIPLMEHCSVEVKEIAKLDVLTCVWILNISILRIKLYNVCAANVIPDMKINFRGEQHFDFPQKAKSR